MAKVNINNIKFLNNPSKFMSSLELEITFECFDKLSDDLEWKIGMVSNMYLLLRCQLITAIFGHTHFETQNDILHKKISIWLYII